MSERVSSRAEGEDYTEGEGYIEGEDQKGEDKKNIKDHDQVFILDQSGSMYEYTNGIKDSYRAYLDDQKRRGVTKDTNFMLVLFSTKYVIIYNGPITEAPRDFDYKPDGGTALYTTIYKVAKDHISKDRLTFINAYTDGNDNSGLYDNNGCAYIIPELRGNKASEVDLTKLREELEPRVRISIIATAKNEDAEQYQRICGKSSHVRTSMSRAATPMMFREASQYVSEQTQTS